MIRASFSSRQSRPISTAAVTNAGQGQRRVPDPAGIQPGELGLVGPRPRRGRRWPSRRRRSAAAPPRPRAVAACVRPCGVRAAAVQQLGAQRGRLVRAQAVEHQALVVPLAAGARADLHPDQPQQPVQRVGADVDAAHPVARDGAGARW